MFGSISSRGATVIPVPDPEVHFIFVIRLQANRIKIKIPNFLSNGFLIIVLIWRTILTHRKNLFELHCTPFEVSIGGLCESTYLSLQGANRSEIHATTNYFAECLSLARAKIKRNCNSKTSVSRVYHDKIAQNILP